MCNISEWIKDWYRVAKSHWKFRRKKKDMSFERWDGLSVGRRARMQVFSGKETERHFLWWKRCIVTEMGAAWYEQREVEGVVGSGGSPRSSHLPQKGWLKRRAVGEFTLHQDLAKAQQWLSELLKSDSEMRREEEATGVQSLVCMPLWNYCTINIGIPKPALVFTALVWLAQLRNKICRNFIIPNAMCFSKEIYMAIKYAKIEYRRGFLMPARNGIEISIAPNELVSTIKIPSLPAT